MIKALKISASLIIGFVAAQCSLLNALLLFAALILVLIYDILTYNKHENEKREEYGKGAKWADENPVINHEVWKSK
jgi:hypothetical protein